MTPRRRWALVAIAAALLVAAPLTPALLPAEGSGITADALRRQVVASDSVGWSGEVSTRGALQIPDVNSFGGVADLLGDNSTLRVWWRDREHWRVDRIRQTGEADLVRDGGRLTSWVFESATATITPYSAVRLPDASDLVPPQMAARLLAGATTTELSRLPSRRVAGRSAPGLRLDPSDPRSTIDHADMWVDEGSGLPVRVQVFATGASQPVVTAEMTRLDVSSPPAETARFLPPPGVRMRSRQAIDVAAGANAFAPFVLPGSVADLARRGTQADLGAVGVYGQGPTTLIAIPLRRRLAGQVRDQLSSSAASRTTPAGTALDVGPLSVLLTDGPRDGGTFLLAGTVTPETLDRAAGELKSTVEPR